MAAAAHDTWSLEEDDVATVSLAEAQAQDAYWHEAHRRENYYRVGLDYEDYAPAYCVGYAGHAQYGGDFGEAEKSLLSNWVRIKGDSRLSLDEARMAMRAAWDRAHACATQPAEAHADSHAGALLRRFLEGANGWLDRLEERLFSPRPAPRAVPRVARRVQQGGFARH
jgi:hypothetical protein